MFNASLRQHENTIGLVPLRTKMQQVTENAAFTLIMRERQIIYRIITFLDPIGELQAGKETEFHRMTRLLRGGTEHTIPSPVSKHRRKMAIKKADKNT